MKNYFVTDTGEKISLLGWKGQNVKSIISENYGELYPVPLGLFSHLYKKHGEIVLLIASEHPTMLETYFQNYLGSNGIEDFKKYTLDTCDSRFDDVWKYVNWGKYMYETCRVNQINSREHVFRYDVPPQRGE